MPSHHTIPPLRRRRRRGFYCLPLSVCLCVRKKSCLSYLSHQLLIAGARNLLHYLFKCAICVSYGGYDFIPIRRRRPVKWCLCFFSLNFRSNCSQRFLSNFLSQMVEILTHFVKACHKLGLIFFNRFDVNFLLMFLVLWFSTSWERWNRALSSWNKRCWSGIR